MSTNYYVTLPSQRHEGACEHCPIGESERLHIGQSPSGLQGYREGPLGPIRSIADWRTALATPGLYIEDEFGQVMTAEEVLAVFESWTPEHRRHQYDWVHDPRHNVYEPERWWLDGEGFFFTYTEFF